MTTHVDLQIKLFKLEQKLGLTEAKLDLLCRWISIKFADDRTLPFEMCPNKNIANEDEVFGRENVHGKSPRWNCTSRARNNKNQNSSNHNTIPNCGSTCERGSLPIPVGLIKQNVSEGNFLRIVDIRSITEPTEPAAKTPLECIHRTRQAYLCRICNMKFRNIESLQNHKMSRCFVPITSLESAKVARNEVAENEESSNSYDNNNEEFYSRPAAEVVQTSNTMSVRSFLSLAESEMRGTRSTILQDRRKQPLLQMLRLKGSTLNPALHPQEAIENSIDTLTDPDPLTIPYRSRSGEIKRRRIRNIGDFICSVCNKRFSQLRYVQKHRQRYHPIDYIKEKDERKRLKKKTPEKKIRESEKYADDSQTGSALTSTLTHKDPDLADAVKQTSHFPPRKRNVGNYQCNICRRQFRVERNLKVHRRCHHPEEHRLDLERAKHEPKKREPNCKKCGEQFSNFRLLKEHTETAQRCRKKKPKEMFRCEECSITYTARATLVQHNRSVHLKERPFLCTECGATFARNEYLKIHLDLHSEERKYKCRYCSKSFSQKPGLDCHMRRHFKSRSQLQCSRCGQFFPGSQTLKRHINGVHDGLRPHSCATCAKSFKSKSQLKWHLKTHEKPGGRQRGLNKEREPLRRRERNNKLAIEPVIEATWQHEFR